MFTYIVNILGPNIKTRVQKAATNMRRIKAQFKDGDVAEKAILARLIVHPEERSMIAAILEAQDLGNSVHRRMFSLIQQMPADLLDAIDTALLQVLYSRADDDLSDLLLLLSCSERPDSISETLMLAVHIHDQSVCRENTRLEEKALRDWLDEEPGFGEPPMADEDEEW